MPTALPCCLKPASSEDPDPNKFSPIMPASSPPPSPPPRPGTFPAALAAKTPHKAPLSLSDVPCPLPASSVLAPLRLTQTQILNLALKLDYEDYRRGRPSLQPAGPAAGPSPTGGVGPGAPTKPAIPSLKGEQSLALLPAGTELSVRGRGPWFVLEVELHGRALEVDVTQDFEAAERDQGSSGARVWVEVVRSCDGGDGAEGGTGARNDLLCALNCGTWEIWGDSGGTGSHSGGTEAHGPLEIRPDWLHLLPDGVTEFRLKASSRAERGAGSKNDKGVCLLLVDLGAELTVHFAKFMARVEWAIAKQVPPKSMLRSAYLPGKRMERTLAAEKGEDDGESHEKNRPDVAELRRLLKQAVKTALREERADLPVASKGSAMERREREAEEGLSDQFFG